MTEAPYRWTLIAILASAILTSGYFRHRARHDGETIARRREPPALIAGRLAIGLPLLLFLFAYLASPRTLAFSQLPLPSAARWLGAVLGAAAVPLVFWTLRSLGRNVSETVLTKRDHELVTHGPYRWVRHPLYATGLLLLAGAALLTASWLIAGLVVVAALGIRLIVIPREEAALIELFGRRYRDYRARTGALLPWPVLRATAPAVVGNGAIGLSRTIVAPWTPYSLAFSRDGGRLAVGGGTWYGLGGILLSDLSSGETVLCHMRDVPADRPSGDAAPTVSGICFSADDRHLAASTWSARQHYDATRLFALDGLALEHRLDFSHRYEDGIGDPCPTGVLLCDDRLIARNNTSILRDVFAVWDLPPDLGVATGGISHHLTSSRVAVVQGEMITGGGGSRALRQWRADRGWGEIGKAADGLVAAPLKSHGRDVYGLDLAGCERITAIAATPAGDGFVTGGLDGEIDIWTRRETWRSRRLRRKLRRRKVDLPGLTWATYRPNSIVGISFLCDGVRMVTLTAAGVLELWHGRERLASWPLPEPGSPRALAAHPHEPRIAAGIKQGGFGTDSHAVVVVDIEAGE